MMESESTSPGDKEVREDMQQHPGRDERKDFIPDHLSSQSSVEPTVFPFPPMCPVKPFLSVHLACCQLFPAPICRALLIMWLLPPLPLQSLSLTTAREIFLESASKRATPPA